MTRAAHILHRLAGILLAPFDAMDPMLGLTILSILTGIAMLWVFGKTTPQAKIRKAKDRMTAAIYEVRLYLDSPVRVASATARMLGWTSVHLALMLPAFVIIGPPMGLMLLHMDMRYGKAPLPIGEPVLVKIQVDNNATARKIRIKPDSKHSVLVTAPRLFVEDEKTLYIRTVITEPGTHTLVVDTGKTSTKKRLAATPDPRTWSPVKTSGITLLWSQTAEPPLRPGGSIKMISVRHPPNNRRWAGLPWWGYWLLISMGAAVLLGRRLGVEL